ncbi:MAG: CRISPR-associated endonuclease Cas2 [Candidatus Anstonellaceae archaeon]
MYVILVYDIEEKRVGKALKLCRQYLIHIQNSVFEGGICEANLVELKSKLQELIEGTDSVIIFCFDSFNPKYISKEILGFEKRSTSNII